ncbi:hypothetical protein C4J98_0944 [Pseudomonas orientalis]|uniref:hypothetical protein n=1 Tax=Pseudomonas orientalis TaxID=76758 RepID=UPI000F56DC06|nr:hypothetical protein [Pseudomonas orientalis]AZE82373.1 hypothetical protein C4J98_0944 [Pseudomonas orientalis]
MLSVLSPVLPRHSAQDITDADALNRQLPGMSESPGPLLLPLRRDVRRLADHVLEKLVPLAGYRRDQAEIEALHRTLCSGEPQLPVTADELAGAYAFFKKAEHLLKPHRNGQKPPIETDYTLCRALKWQFRAAVREGKHQGLTQELLPSLNYIRERGERINHRHLGYNFALESTRQATAGPHLAIDSRLEVTADQRVKSTRTIALQVKLKSALTNLSQARSDQQFGLAHVSSRQYASLEHYADNRSSSVNTSLSESVARTVVNLGSLLSDQRNLHRDRAYSALSQPYVRDALTHAGLAEGGLPRLQNSAAPLITEKGLALKVDSNIAVDCFSVLTVNTTLALTLQRTRLRKDLDILGLCEMSPALAQHQLAMRVKYHDDPVTLLDEMNTHVASSSRLFTEQACAPVLASELNASLHKSQRQARALLERYVSLKATWRIAPDLDGQFRTAINQNRALLRPEALKIYKLTAECQTLSGSAGVTASSRAGAGRGVTIEVSHRKLDDPHLSGDYLVLDIAPIKSVEAVKESLRQALSSIGQQTFDWEHLVRSISASLLDPAIPSSTQVLVKIKHGEPVTLLTRHTVDKDRELALPEQLKQHSDLDLQSLRTRKTLLKEQLGNQSLDHLLPVARRYLHTPDERPGWDAYLQRHADDIQALLDSIGRQTLGTVLSAELDEFKRISPALALAVETLAQQAHAAIEEPTAEHRTQALDAFNQLLLAYLPHYEAKVSEAWTLS